VNLRIDWAQYFRDFCSAHGATEKCPPLMYGNRLLFPDGWSYGAHSHKGPEWPPPIDPEKKWQQVRTYWRLRRRAVNHELITARLVLADAEAASFGRSAPLTTVSRQKDYESGKVVEVRIPLDLDALRERVKWLETDYRECESTIRDRVDDPSLTCSPNG
jgi:hypothetical protein